MLCAFVCFSFNFWLACAGSPVVRPKALPIVPKEEKNYSKKANPPRTRASKLGPNDSSSSSSGSRSLASKKSPKISPEAISSHRLSPSKATPALKRNADHGIKAHHPKQETRFGSKGSEVMMNALKLLGEIVSLEEHVSEGGEVMYQIPKQQFEVLSQGVQDVLHELQSIKSALNIDKSSLL